MQVFTNFCRGSILFSLTRAAEHLITTDGVLASDAIFVQPLGLKEEFHSWEGAAIGGLLMGDTTNPELRDGEDDVKFAAARRLVELVSNGRTVLHAFEIDCSGTIWEVVVRRRLSGD